MTMQLGELIRQLEAARAAGASDESPIVIEGYDEDDNFIQAWISSVTTESRCEEGAQGVYLNIEEMTIG